MHYYRRNLGDYAKKAGRLTILQHGVYNLLLDACYDRERFPTRDEAIEWTWAVSPDEIAAVDFVLSRMFTLSPETGQYIQGRVVEEIAEYKKYCEKQALNGKSGGRPRKPSGNPEKPSGLPVETQWQPKKRLTTNQLTTNQITTNQSKRFAPPALDEVISEMTGRTQDPTHEANRFLAYYESNGWKVGRNPMKSWKAAVTNWVTKTKQPQLIDSSQTGLAARLTDTSWV